MTRLGWLAGGAGLDRWCPPSDGHSASLLADQRLQSPMEGRRILLADDPHMLLLREES